MSGRYDRSAITPTRQPAWLLAKRSVAGDRQQSAWLTNDLGVVRLFSWPQLVQAVQPFQPFLIEFNDNQLLACQRHGASLWPPASNILFAQYCNDCLRLLLAEGEPSDLAASYGELLVALQSKPWQTLWQPFEQQLYRQALSLGLAEASDWRQTFLAGLPADRRVPIEQQRHILESMQ